MLQPHKISMGLAELEAMDRATLAKQWQKLIQKPLAAFFLKSIVLRATV